MPDTLLIRADAGFRMGSGHVMRCLALGQAWLDAGGTVAFASAPDLGSLEPRLASEGFRVHRVPEKPGSRADAAWTGELAREEGARVVAVDGYQFDETFQEDLARGFRSVLVVDDHAHLRRYHGRWLLNQNLHAREVEYRDRAPAAELMLGPAFALLRREFRRRQGPARSIPPTARNILLTFGGSDPLGLTPRALRALREASLTEIEVLALLGSGATGGKAVEAEAKSCPFSVRRLRDPGDLPSWFTRADIAVAAAGSTCWELAYLGVPSVVVAVAPNQRPIAASLDEAGAAVEITVEPPGFGAQLAEVVSDLVADPERRRAMADAGRGLVEGRGAQRVVRRLRQGTAAADSEPPTETP